MAKEIVGVRAYDFEDAKTHERVTGFSLYLQWVEDGVEGIACEALSVQTKKLDGYVPGVGDLVRVGYNRWNKCDFIIPVGSAN